MAAGQGFKTFVTGDVLTAADTNGYLMQGVWVFASAAARDAAVTSPQEGNTCYLKDTDVIQCYSGSAWVQKSSSGAGSGLTLVKRASFSAVASTTTTFDGVFTSTYDNYVIVADKVYGSSSGADLRLQWRVGAVTQAGASYYGAYFGYNYGVTLVTNGVNAGTSFVLSQVGNSTTETTAFNITATKVVTSDTAQMYGTLFEAARAVPLVVGGKYNTSIAADGFILSLSTGNITGTVSVYGLAKS
jgi:hypothetical protein